MPRSTHFGEHVALVSLRHKEVFLEFLSELGEPHATLFLLLKWCINGCRMNCLVRTTPPEFTQTASCDFDKAVLETVEATCNVVLCDIQRTRADFQHQETRFGVALDCGQKTEATYIASRNATHIWCTQIRHCLSHRGPKAFSMSNCKAPWKLWISCCLGWMWPRWNLTRSLKACSTNGSMSIMRSGGAVKLCHQNGSTFKLTQISLVPTKTLDTHLSPCATVPHRLGVDVTNSGRPCNHCCQQMVAHG